MRFATGLALLIGFAGGIALGGFESRLVALEITALQVVPKDTRTAVEMRGDLDRKK